jgi:hypothetical protein
MRAPQTEPPIPSDADLSWTPDSAAAREISGTLNALLADLFTLHLKTKNFHWHVCGPQFRDYHLMFDEQAAEIFHAADLLAARVRKLGGSRSVRLNTCSAWLVFVAMTPIPFRPLKCSLSCGETTGNSPNSCGTPI